jgi:regulator of ribonuclease activity A
MVDAPVTGSADLCDADAAVQVIALPWRRYGGRPHLQGPLATLHCPGHIGLMREAVAQPGQGRVLLIDGGGALDCALFGDRMAERAIANGWAGVVVHGAVRDVAALATLPLAVMALGSCPRRGRLESIGQVNMPLHLAGVTVEPGRFVVADDDGVVVLPPGRSPAEVLGAAG